MASSVRDSNPGVPRSTAPLVVVVDDFEDAREMYGEYLSVCGFRVADAQNGLEAVEKTRALLPDLVLMDLSLPIMDGWEATRRLKQDELTRHIPVIAVTGHALVGCAESARRAGCDAFITKPCLPDALVDEVNRMLARARPGEVGQSHAETARLATEAPGATSAHRLATEALGATSAPRRATEALGAASAPGRAAATRAPASRKTRRLTTARPGRVATRRS